MNEADEQDHQTPANFGVFRDTLLLRLKSITAVRTEFEKRLKETEQSVEQRMSSLKRQLEQKWRALDNFENSVRKLETTRVQWRAKYATKEGELEAAKVSQVLLLEGRAEQAVQVLTNRPETQIFHVNYHPPPTLQPIQPKSAH
jgi:hypothetical protein